MTAKELYRAHKGEVFHLCLRYCGGQVELAEDVTHDVFVKLLEHIDQLSDKNSLSPWLYRVTSNACYSRLERDNSVWGRVAAALSRQPKPSSSSPEQELRVRQELEGALNMLESLPAKERIVFCMHILDELPQQEICQILSLSKGQVSKLIKRARGRILKGVCDV